MQGYLRDYKGAFQRGHKLGWKRWIMFSLKSVLLFIVLYLAICCFQYALLFYTSLYEHVTVNDVQLSSLLAITLMLLISAMPSIIYLVKLIFR